MHEASGGLEVLGGEDAAGGDVELGEAVPDPDQWAFAGIEVVVHLSVGRPWGRAWSP